MEQKREVQLPTGESPAKMQKCSYAKKMAGSKIRPPISPDLLIGAIFVGNTLQSLTFILFYGNSTRARLLP